MLNRYISCETALYSGFSLSCVAVATAKMQSKMPKITRISEKNHTRKSHGQSVEVSQAKSVEKPVGRYARLAFYSQKYQ